MDHLMRIFIHLKKVQNQCSRLQRIKLGFIRLVWIIVGYIIFLSKLIYQGNKDKKVTFAIHSGNNTDTHLSQEHLDRLFTKLKSIENKVKEVKITEKIITKKTESHHEGNFIQ